MWVEQHDRLARLIGDSDINGDLLLVGAALLAGFDANLTGEHTPEVLDAVLTSIADHLWRDLPGRARLIRSVLRMDIRTYRRPAADHRCTAPADGSGDGRCGAVILEEGWLTDWDTAELTYIAGCRHHLDWFHTRRLEHQANRPGPLPLPHANHGGRLARHVLDINWPQLWRHLDRHWVTHPEPPATAPIPRGLDGRPRLTVVSAAAH